MKPSVNNIDIDYIKNIIRQEGLVELIQAHARDYNVHILVNDKAQIKTNKNKIDEHTDLDNNLHLTTEQIKKIKESDSVSSVNSKIQKCKSDILKHANSNIHPSLEKQRRWDNTYTKEEIINLLKGAVSGFTWGPDAESLNHLKNRFKNTNPVTGYIAYCKLEKRYFYAINGKFKELEIIIPEATKEVSGLMINNDKDKLDSIEPNANFYIHPDDAYTRHITDEQIAYFTNKADNELATNHSPGLMSPEDKRILSSAKEKLIENIQVSSIDTYFNNSNNKSITITRNPKLFVNGIRFVIEEHDNDSEIIHNAIKNTVNGSTIYIDSGTYCIDEILTINQSNITICGTAGTTLVKVGTGKSIFKIIGDNNLIKDISCNIQSNNPSNFIAIDILGNNNIIDNINCKYGVGIKIEGSYNKVHNCLAENCNIGILVSSETRGSTANLLTNNIINTSVFGISIVGGAKPNTNNTISNNICFGDSVGIRLINTVPTIITTKHNIITNNNVAISTTDNPAYGTSQHTILVNSNYNIISNNIIRGKDVTLLSGVGNNINNNII